MDWMRQVNNYCERVGFGYWDEPINAVTNAAFLIAAAIMWRRTRGLPLGRALCVVLAAIGIGSYLFHTHATVWAMLADIMPIGLYILLYIYVANRAYWGLSVPLSLLGTAAFIPWTMALTPAFGALPFFDVSAFYWPVPVLILLYAVLLRNRAPRAAGGLAIGAGVLIVSLAFRSVDQQLCAQIPIGTHFMWHVLNGVMLGWMIEVYRRHVQEGGAAAGRLEGAQAGR